jgi:hypothetical protein
MCIMPTVIDVYHTSTANSRSARNRSSLFCEIPDNSRVIPLEWLALVPYVFG